MLGPNGLFDHNTFYFCRYVNFHALILSVLMYQMVMCLVPYVWDACHRTFSSASIWIKLGQWGFWNRSFREKIVCVPVCVWLCFTSSPKLASISSAISFHNYNGLGRGLTRLGRQTYRLETILSGLWRFIKTNEQVKPTFMRWLRYLHLVHLLQHIRANIVYYLLQSFSYWLLCTKSNDVKSLKLATPLLPYVAIK